ncbi:MAG: hypothetical protein ABL925_09465, partial [Methylococcales bacterium]
TKTNEIKPELEIVKYGEPAYVFSTLFTRVNDKLSGQLNYQEFVFFSLNAKMKIIAWIFF